jgi:hypothetical protein
MPAPLLITINGVTRPMREWCEIYQISPAAVSMRVARGWTRQEAITTPYVKHRNRRKGKSRGKYA